MTVSTHHGLADPVPAVMIFRDRWQYGMRCLGALQALGCAVVVLDHGTTYPPAVDWLAEVRRGGTPVVGRGDVHPRSVWDWPGLRDVAGAGRYVVTDPDVVPEAGAARWLNVAWEVLDRNPDVVKCGPALWPLGLPERYEHAEKVAAWESRWWRKPRPPGDFAYGATLYDAPVDTTLALYRSLDEVPDFRLEPAVRLGHPLLARHMTWYEDSAHPADDVAWYRRRALPFASHWNDPDAYVEVADRSGER